mmetsp:Transcript_21649/g.54498  ORF Transcript_21649/g.54498 Transcript_21649/m.54498 type:complete len:363 (-) Transcript_21649:1053-2141(-)
MGAALGSVPAQGGGEHAPGDALPGCAHSFAPGSTSCPSRYSSLYTSDSTSALSYGMILNTTRLRSAMLLSADIASPSLRCFSSSYSLAIASAPTISSMLRLVCSTALLSFSARTAPPAPPSAPPSSSSLSSSSSSSSLPPAPTCWLVHADFPPSPFVTLPAPSCRVSSPPTTRHVGASASLRPSPSQWPPSLISSSLTPTLTSLPARSSLSSSFSPNTNAMSRCACSRLVPGLGRCPSMSPETVMVPPLSGRLRPADDLLSVDSFLPVLRFTVLLFFGPVLLSEEPFLVLEEVPMPLLPVRSIPELADAKDFSGLMRTSGSVMPSACAFSCTAGSAMMRSALGRFCAACVRQRLTMSCSSAE